MIQAEKMMMIGGLAAGMAHEINNPLGIITQSAQIIQRRFDPAIQANQEIAAQCHINFDQFINYLEQRQIADFLVKIRKAATRAAKIISNMLTFSRKNESLAEKIELPRLFDQVLELAAGDYEMLELYDFKQVAIIKEYADVLPVVTMTVLEIEQVLLNLLKNSSHALHTAGTKAPRIVLRAKGENGFALIEIEDNGPGMSSDVQKRIFEPFYTTKPVGQGTGLGLSVSYAIVTNNHHGTLEVHSQPGIGTCFTIRLPLSS
jgi:signal transduction histidine kinase